MKNLPSQKNNLKSLRKNAVYVFNKIPLIQL